MAVGQSGEKDADLAGSADGMLLEICLWADNPGGAFLNIQVFSLANGPATLHSPSGMRCMVSM